MKKIQSMRKGKDYIKWYDKNYIKKKTFRGADEKKFVDGCVDNFRNGS